MFIIYIIGLIFYRLKIIDYLFVVERDVTVCSTNAFRRKL